MDGDKESAEKYPPLYIDTFLLLWLNVSEYRLKE